MSPAQTMRIDRKLAHRVATGALLLMFAAGTSAQTSNVVKIESGQIRGAAEGKVIAFRGVPFAAPPLGDLRWRAPQPVRPWDGIRPAEKYASDCMQEPFPSDAAPLGSGISEDCLYLNLWKPASSDSKKLPVMVWIYGGGFVNGGSSPDVYDGSAFAADGIVFVSFNYRIGRFGFFAYPALTAEHPEEPKGNYGYLDQIAALQWVQKNIAAFGGDPKQVTVFGESAGGGSVLTLLTSPLSQGLFQRAIIESGGGRALLMGKRFVSKDSADGRPSAEKVGVNFAASVGITDPGAAGLAALRKLPAEKICAGLGMMTMMQAANTYSGPVEDGKIVRESPQEAILAGRWAKVPVMIGANSADIGFPGGRTIDELFAPFGANAEKAKAIYNPEHSENVWLVGARIAMDQMMVEPSRFVARAVSAQGIPAWEYRFSYVAESMRDKWPGAPHATEIPYVFHTVKAVYKDRLTATDDALSLQAHASWVAFVKSGDPSIPGAQKWATQNPQSDILMNFTNKGPVVEADPWKERLDLIENLAEQQAKSGK